MNHWAVSDYECGPYGGNIKSHIGMSLQTTEAARRIHYLNALNTRNNLQGLPLFSQLHI